MVGQIILPGLSTALEYGEPVFALRGKDPASPATIRAWIEERRKLNKPEDAEKLKRAEIIAANMEEWHSNNVGTQSSISTEEKE